MENNQNQNSAQPTREVVKPNEEIQSEFYNTGRIGRRNALGDILKNEHCTTNTADSQSFVTTFEKNCVLTTKPGESFNWLWFLKWKQVLPFLEPGSNGNSSGINQQPNESSNK